MRVFSEKQGEKGFTLIEMLIVVAIISILIAISIPLVGNALDRVRCATDAANERAAKAAMTIMYMNDRLDGGKLTFANLDNNDTNGVYVYDAANGKFILYGDPGFGEVTSYGQCTVHEHSGGKKLFARISEDGVIQLGWGKGIGGTHGVVPWNNLCSPHLNSG